MAQIWFILRIQGKTYAESMRMLIKAINRVDRVSEAIYKNSQVEINKVFKQNFDHYGELKENIWPMICTYRRVIYFLKT